jgi:protein N-terminal methyltransferase
MASFGSSSSSSSGSGSGGSKDESTLSVKELEEMLIAACGPISGCDSDDKDYTSIQDLWNSELNRWYENAQEFWDDPEKCPITDDGVLQGYGKLTPVDTKGSNAFLDKMLTKEPTLQFDRVADCGAGVGRVTKNLLLARFKHVDLIEQSPRLSAATAKYIGAGPEDAKRITCIVQGLQDFAPAPNTYDVIWIQWVIGHLHDLDTIRFFRRCAAGLKPNGLIVLKDNVSSAGKLLPSVTATSPFFVLQTLYCHCFLLHCNGFI